MSGKRTNNATPQRFRDPWLGRIVAASVVVPALAWLPQLASPFAAAKYAATTLCALAVAICLMRDAPESARSLKRLLRARVAWLLFGVLGLLVLSAVFGIDLDRSVFGALGEFRGVALWVSVAIIAAGVWVVADTDDEARIALILLVRAVTVSAAVIAFGAVVQALGADRADFAGAVVSARPRSSLGNASNLGVWLVAALPYAVACARSDTQRLWRDIGAGGSALALAALALTLSRGALVGLVVSGVVWLAFSWRDLGASRGKVGAALAVLLVGLVVATLLVSPGSAKRLVSVATLSGSDVTYRATLWQVAGRMVAQRPLLGWGPATFSEVLGPLRPKGFHRTGSTYRQTLDPHNATVSLAQEAGPLAALLLLAALGALAVLCWRSDARSEPLLVTAATSVFGAFAALQSHFFTGEVAVLFASSFAVVLALASRTAHREQDVMSHGSINMHKPALLALVGIAAVLATTGLLLAGASWQQARARAAGTWSQAVPHLDAARALTGFTHLFDQSAAQDVLARLSRSADRAFFEYGAQAAAEARDASPEPMLVLIEADLAMLYGVRAKDAEAIASARTSYSEHEALDPTSPAAALGQGILAEAEGKVSEAAALYAEAVAKDKKLVLAWRGLERTLRASGDTGGADKARARLSDLTGEKGK